MVGRYTHSYQFKRGRRELKFLRTRLGRIIRDIRRKIEATQCWKCGFAIRTNISADRRSIRCMPPR